MDQVPGLKEKGADGTAGGLLNVPSAAGSSKVGDDPEVIEIGEHDVHGGFLYEFGFIPMPASGLFASLKEQRKK